MLEFIRDIANFFNEFGFIPHSVRFSVIGGRNIAFVTINDSDKEYVSTTMAGFGKDRVWGYVVSDGFMRITVHKEVEKV